MKRLIFLIHILVALHYTSTAQINKGRVLVGGSISKSTNDYHSPSTSSKASSIFLNTSFGKIIKDNRVAGILLNYGRSTNSIGEASGEDDYYGGGIFYRRYFVLGKSLYLFGQTTAVYSLTDREEINPNSKYTLRSHSVGLGLTPGIAYAASKRFLLEAGLNSLAGLNYNWGKSGYIYSAGESKGKHSGSSFYIDINPRSDLFVGFRIALGN